VVDGGKPVRLTVHARNYQDRRGFTEADVIDVIRTRPRRRARGGRKEASKDFRYDAEWNSVRYARRRVRPVFIEEPDEIVVITVYTYSF
jgi:hypothetical protein